MAAAALTLALVLPFSPHSESELADWQSGWNDRIEANGGVLDRNLIFEFTDMRERHPCDLNQVCRRATVRAASVAAPASGVYRGMGSDVEQWRDLTASYFRPEDVDRALCLMSYESGGNPAAFNPSGATGLMQVKDWWAPSFGVTAADLFDPATNLWVAAQIRDLQGWDAWSPYNRGLCH